MQCLTVNFVFRYYVDRMGKHPDTTYRLSSLYIDQSLLVAFPLLTKLFSFPWACYFLYHACYFLYHLVQCHVTLAKSSGLNSMTRYPRRDRSRSRSRSPARRRDRGGYHRPSPRRSRSPAEQTRRDASNRPPRSGHGGGPDHRGSSPPVNRGRSRSRSKSRDLSRSKSPEAAPAKRESSRYNRRRSSSSRSSSPDGNKGLVSY
jgi:hypothetical protein